MDADRTVSPEGLHMLQRRAVLGLLWAAAVTAMAVLVGRYWIPLDDGTLAQSAERMLLGELPHRDFGDPYTGLNALVGALAFKLFGVRLISLRVPLVAGFALWLPAVWLLARRFVGPAMAMAASVLAATVSVLAYPAAMPTWFGLYAVTWGTLFLLVGMERGHRRWFLGAGMAAGVAVLFKVVGLYFLAAALLALVWHRTDGSRGYTAFAATGVGFFLVFLGRLVLPRSGLSGTVHFFVPAAALCGALLVRVSAGRLRSAWGPGHGVAPLILDGSTVVLGAALPVVAFLVPYFLSGSVEAWLEGVFVLPVRRFEWASSSPGAAWTVVPGLVAVALAGTATRVSPTVERRAAMFLAALLALALALDDAADGAVMSALWYSVKSWIPALALLSAVGLAAAARRTPTDDDAAGSAPAFAVLAVAALWALVQFPYTAPAYFFYVAPLGVLATLGAICGGWLRPGPVLGLLAAVYLFLGSGYVAGVARSGTSALEVDRGGIHVSATDAALYGELTQVIGAHLSGGGLWAGPDAPEVYFLAGAANPTPTFYEFMDPVPRLPTDLETVFREHDVRVAVVNTRPLFSLPLDPVSLERIRTIFPESMAVGPFVVYWRLNATPGP